LHGQQSMREHRGVQQWHLQEQIMCQRQRLQAPGSRPMRRHLRLRLCPWSLCLIAQRLTMRSKPAPFNDVGSYSLKSHTQTVAVSYYSPFLMSSQAIRHATFTSFHNPKCHNFPCFIFFLCLCEATVRFWNSGVVGPGNVRSLPRPWAFGGVPRIRWADISNPSSLICINQDHMYYT
jgi:hypothetical protein